jgi:hypothetical protein
MSVGRNMMMSRRNINGDGAIAGSKHMPSTKKRVGKRHASLRRKRSMKRYSGRSKRHDQESELARSPRLLLAWTKT